MGKARKRIFELDTIVAAQRAEIRMKRRQQIELLDETTPGGVLGGPGYNRDAALAALDEEEGSYRISMMLAERESLRAQQRANAAIIVSICVGIANLAVTLVMTLGSHHP